MHRISIFGAGAMGSGIGRRLVEGGADVLTDLDGRSAASLERAQTAGMRSASMEEILAADLILSIVPPAEAVAVAGTVAQAARNMGLAPTFIDCNAVAPKTVAQVVSILSDAGVPALDGCIIGAPPAAGKKGPKLYISGDAARSSALLAEHGIDLRLIDGAAGAASALKMCYSGINKGLTGLGTAMLLAAIGAGADDGLKRELADSVPEVLQKLEKGIPDMYSKAYRWVAEMEEIAEFLGDDDPAAQIFRGMAGLYRRMSDDRQGDRLLAAALDGLLTNG